MADLPAAARGVEPLPSVSGGAADAGAEQDDRPHGRVGIVDIGSNTVRLVVYDVPTRLPIPIFNEKAQCGLGSGLGRSGPSGSAPTP